MRVCRWVYERECRCWQRSEASHSRELEFQIVVRSLMWIAWAGNQRRQALLTSTLRYFCVHIAYNFFVLKMFNISIPTTLEYTISCYHYNNPTVLLNIKFCVGTHLRDDTSIDPFRVLAAPSGPELCMRDG